MNVTEAPPDVLADAAGQEPDDLLADGWAAPVVVGPDPRDFERLIAEAIALRNVIHDQNATITDLHRQLDDARPAVAGAENRRDEALGECVRRRAEAIRLDAENRGLRERLDALTRANHARSARTVFGSLARRIGRSW